MTPNNTTNSHKVRNQKLFFAALLACVLLFSVFNNPHHSILPGCYFKSITGYDCPSCGLSRSFHAFSHLKVTDAFHFHLLGPVIFVLLLFIFLKLIVEVVTKKTIRIPMKPITGKIAFLSFMSFWIFYWITRLV